MFEPLHKLKGPQEAASRPSRDVWLSASAGTGKTQVLAARVLRLLLHGNDPESILCLTFTKAGASEMAERIHERLGAWVTAKSTEIAHDLIALGEAGTPEMVAHARTLFARLLDARGAGLRIQTIHAFCQSLLGSFPAEADLVPGFRGIDEREVAALHASALSAMVDAARAEGRSGLIEALERLSLDPGEEAVRRMLARCAANPQAMEALGWHIGPRVREWLGLGEQPVEETIAALVADGALDVAPIRAIRDLNAAWGTGRGLERVAIIDAWLECAVEGRCEGLKTLHSVWATGDKLKSTAKGWAPPGDDYAGLIAGQFEVFSKLLGLRKLAALADRLTDALAVGQDYARHYREAKRRVGAVDFDDLIASAAALLTTPGMGEWIRYKLDQRTDHVLIDEAQDTNARQWDIVKAVAGEFFAGLGAQDGAVRTLFTVGDYKQAIFGFQGTDPEEFARAHAHFDALVANPETGRALDTPELSESFRSGPPVLDLVDGVIAELGHEAFGIEKLPEAHVSGRGGSGQVVLWAPFGGPESDAADEEGGGEEGWLSDAELRFAADLARKVRDWTSGGLRLRNRGDRPARPGDVLILVRSRGELARAIVSRLNEEKVPVAGVDRLRLAAPIAVQDLLAAIRFVLQPEDDLNLAALLVSPLIGWDQDRLYAHARGREGVPLWRHLGEARPPECREMLRIADLSTPYRFLEALLSGPIEGRRKLLARLGEEARDPVEALLDAALAFERDNPPSLQLFCDWLGRGDVEVVRDPGQAGDAVRVMTVHGAKGLQAPIVVLADATRAHGGTRERLLDWETEIGKLTTFRPRKSERTGVVQDLADRQDARDLREHWRLLYVALTRAEEHLFIGGALKPSQAGKPLKDDVWHQRVAAAMRALGATGNDGALRFGRDGPILKPDADRSDGPHWQGPLPDWLAAPAPAEARPPRPLAPSAAEPRDSVADPPPAPGLREAAEKGRRLHALFERLPGVAPDGRAAAADLWLRNAEGIADVAERGALIAKALEVIEHPQAALFFAPEALAEAPIAGVVEGRVIAGTVDRLVIRDDAVLIAEFKTGRRVPRDAASAPETHLAQIAAYAAVVGGMFPDRRIAAALVYTAEPRLIAVPRELLEAHKPGYREAQQNLTEAG